MSPNIADVTIETAPTRFSTVSANTVTVGGDSCEDLAAPSGAAFRHRGGCENFKRAKCRDQRRSVVVVVHGSSDSHGLQKYTFQTAVFTGGMIVRSTAEQGNDNYTAQICCTNSHNEQKMSFERSSRDLNC